MHVALILKQGSESTGVGRYALELEEGLIKAGWKVTRVYPEVPFPSWMNNLIKRCFGWDLDAFINNYPVFIKYPQADIYHFLSQNLATLLKIKPPKGRTIATVHDIFPMMLKNNTDLRVFTNYIALLFDRLAMKGLSKADHIIAVSSYTRKMLTHYLNFDNEHITVILEGVSRD